MKINTIKRKLLDYNIFFILSIPLYFFRIFKIKNNKIIVVNYNGKGYGDNGKYIVDQLINNDKYLIYWAINNKKIANSLPMGVNYVKYNSFFYFYHLYTSKVWINNSRFPSYIKKRKKQFYIQTWHSSIRLKKIEADAKQYLSKEYIRSAKNDSKMIDVILCGCAFSKQTYMQSFWYNGKIAMTGTPKYDSYFNLSEKNKIKQKLLKQWNIDETKKIVLYAPTFRNNNKSFSGTLNIKELLKNKRLDNYIFLLRLHPNSKTIIKEEKRLIDVTDYPNIQDLIIACDYLITDYSGCCFDSLIANKKCILYVPDLDDYLKKERELYFSFDELPFPKIMSTKDLINCLLSDYDEDYEKKAKRFKSRIGLIEDGKASIRVMQIIDEVIGGKNEEV